MDRIESLISELTLEEKVSILSGSSAWHTTAVPRLNIPRVKMTDGPIGARGDSVSGETAACFPSASCLSSSWDKESVASVAKAIGVEVKNDITRRLLPIMMGDQYSGWRIHFLSYF